MSGLDEARRKIEERREQQKQNFNPTNLWLRTDDLVVAHFICSGQDGDPYFETYVSHEYPAKGQGQWPTRKYCPVESGHDLNYPCEGCREGLKTKDQMIMWFWVYDILHSALKQGESFPQVVWNNKTYFQRTINGPRVWDTSAWRESPLDDILVLGSQLGSLYTTRINLISSGSNMTRRYKIYMEPSSPPFSEEMYEQAKPLIRPVIEILQEQLVVTPVIPNPNPASHALAPPAEIKPYATGGNVPQYSAPATPSKPSAKKMF